jgi:hypothetical protein
MGTDKVAFVEKRGGATGSGPDRNRKSRKYALRMRNRYILYYYCDSLYFNLLYVFVFLFFFSIVIGNKLIKRNYLITFFYYRLITNCN